MSNVETIKVVPARYPLRAAGAVVALFVLADRKSTRLNSSHTN